MPSTGGDDNKSSKVPIAEERRALHRAKHMLRRSVWPISLWTKQQAIRHYFAPLLAMLCRSNDRGRSVDLAGEI